MLHYALVFPHRRPWFARRPRNWPGIATASGRADRLDPVPRRVILIVVHLVAGRHPPHCLTDARSRRWFAPPDEGCLPPLVGDRGTSTRRSVMSA